MDQAPDVRTPLRPQWLRTDGDDLDAGKSTANRTDAVVSVRGLRYSRGPLQESGRPESNRKNRGFVFRHRAHRLDGLVERRVRGGPQRADVGRGRSEGDRVAGRAADIPHADLFYPRRTRPPPPSDWGQASAILLALAR